MFHIQGQKFQGANVPNGTKVLRERKFSLWTFCSQEQKCWGIKNPDRSTIHSRPIIGSYHFLPFQHFSSFFSALSDKRARPFCVD